MTNWNSAQFKYVNLTTPVTLAANTSYYIVSQETSGGDKWSSDTDTTLVPTDIAAINGTISSADGVTYGTPGMTVNKSFGPVDFIYEPVDSAYIKIKTLGTVRNNLAGYVGIKITTGDTTVNVRSLGRIFVKLP